MFKKIRKVLYRSILSNDISYDMAKRILKQNNATLIDVRSKQEHQEGHLPASINISLYDLKNNIAKVIPNKNTTIVLYCASGNRSKQAKQILDSMGYTDVYNLKNGLNSII